jgi:hypothetical protein
VSPPPDGLEAWKQVTERGFEGYVAKDEASVYEGGPTRRWLKVKQKDSTVEEDGWRRRILQRSLAQIPAPRDHEPDRGLEDAGAADPFAYRFAHSRRDWGS